jgi:hypothetical protein
MTADSGTHSAPHPLPTLEEVVTTILDKPTTATADLSLVRLHSMRVGYLLMGVGLALVKWPKLPDAHTMPLYEGVTWSLLTAMSLLAFLGLRYPVKMLPVLIFETTWKVLWFGVVALPQALDGGLDQAASDTAVSCSLVVVIIAVIPWRYAWDSFVRTPGDRWRGPR